MDYKAVAQAPLAGEDYGRGRMQFRYVPGSNGMIGRVDAIDLRQRQTLWSQSGTRSGRVHCSSLPAGQFSAATPTVRAVALDERSGKKLWALPLSSQPGGFPMTYMASGRQFLAIPGGLQPDREPRHPEPERRKYRSNGGAHS